MNLKNYTSGVSPEKSVMLIEKRLVGIGATHIAKSYEDSKLSGVMFQINQHNRPVSFKLPANTKLITEMMLSEIKRPQRDTEKRIRDQVQRTAWKLLLDWVDVQASMITIGRREATEVFLPYMYDFKNEETLYQKLQASNFKMLGTGKHECQT